MEQLTVEALVRKYDFTQGRINHLEFGNTLFLKISFGPENYESPFGFENYIQLIFDEFKIYIYEDELTVENEFKTIDFNRKDSKINLTLFANEQIIQIKARSFILRIPSNDDSPRPQPDEVIEIV